MKQKKMRKNSSRSTNQLSDVIDVIKMSVKSRLIVLLLQLVFNLLINDHKSDAFVNGLESELNSSFDLMVNKLFSGLNRWDSQYFMAIAHKGYSESEQFLAFFPLFPLVIRFMANIFDLINFDANHKMFSYYCLLIISAVLVNITLFVLASIVLYKLTIELFKNLEFGKRAVHWFCYNPSSIFFSAFYSESLFCFLTFSGIYLTNHSLLMASFAFGLSSATRSNGRT